MTATSLAEQRVVITAALRAGVADAGAEVIATINGKSLSKLRGCRVVLLDVLNDVLNSAAVAACFADLTYLMSCSTVRGSCMRAASCTSSAPGWISLSI